MIGWRIANRQLGDPADCRASHARTDGLRQINLP
jgi:hypothetical protein